MTRIVAISDLHGTLPKREDMPEGDILLIGGDICPTINHYVDYQVRWLNQIYAPWLDGLDYKHKIWIAGNHDLALESTVVFGDKTPGTYLKNEHVIVEGLKIFGSPYSCKFGNWAFMAGEEILSAMWDEEIDKDIDIMLVHGPPFGILDLAVSFGMANVGSPSLRRRIEHGAFPYLKLGIFGHIHESRGTVGDKRTLFANVSQMNADYEPVHKAMVFDLDKDGLI
jgi:Icc-related predicted phosphoesterase